MLILSFFQMSDPWRTSNSAYGSFLQSDGRAARPLTAELAAGIPAELRPSSLPPPAGSHCEPTVWKRGDGIRIVRIDPPTEAGVLGCEREAALFWDGVRCGTLQFRDDFDPVTISSGAWHKEQRGLANMVGFGPALDAFFAPKRWRVSGVRLVHVRGGDAGEASVEVDGVRVGNIRFSEDRDEATIYPMPPEVRRVGEALYTAIEAYFCSKRWSLS